MVNLFKHGVPCHLPETIEIPTFSNGSFSSVTPYDGIMNHGITNAAHPMVTYDQMQVKVYGFL